MVLLALVGEAVIMPTYSTDPFISQAIQRQVGITRRSEQSAITPRSSV
jgi:hypothetical protein